MIWNFLFLYMKRILSHICFIVCLLSTCIGFSQKVMERSIDATNIKSISIASDLVYTISISSKKTSDVQIKATVEGETYEQIVLGIKEEGNELHIQPAYTPFFKANNDKLAAHKVLSIELELLVPDNCILNVNSSLTSLHIVGSLPLVNAQLEKGNCILKQFSGNASLKTNRGFIEVYANKTVKGNGFSKNGTVINELNEHGRFQIQAETVDGDISFYVIE